MDIPSSSVANSQNNVDGGPSILAGNSEIPVEEPTCRKSSRLKAKMSKKTQEVAQGEDSDAYNLRLSSLVKRVQVERRQNTPRQPKGKSKPPPLSKYRRRTANARERMRMKEINDAFEELRVCLPEMEQEKNEGKKKESPTKLTVLNLAMNYIRALRDILGYAPFDEKNDSNSSSNNNDSNSSSSVATVPSEESDLGSDATSPRTGSVSSASCDDIGHNLSPDILPIDQKELPANLVTCELAKDLLGCHDPLPSSSTMMEFRGEATSSPTSSASSLPPSPPSLLLPDECMDLDQADLLDVSMSLAALDDIDDIVL